MHVASACTGSLLCPLLQLQVSIHSLIIIIQNRKHIAVCACTCPSAGHMQYHRQQHNKRFFVWGILQRLAPDIRRHGSGTRLVLRWQSDNIISRSTSRNMLLQMSGLITHHLILSAGANDYNYGQSLLYTYICNKVYTKQTHQCMAMSGLMS